ncbi:hypothetical protein [Wenxinia marina]|uniref:ATP-dependent endonuclease n=1 Tax=Wenxinia marina DSM 24838 TaxID=1123501 RepID=A0A0D0Q9Y6_9RHOB|nr:hypothetical protein [Wenxinia marina]KIQ69152.1 hypothetical protein Wenmar_02221 [Wenxinia marina DSM 24838]GGL70739.1 hypothetical protein GCM10011392_26620 [Wenxinia marina]
MSATRRIGAAGHEHGPDAPLHATAEALVRAERAARVLLVEGISDVVALETLAEVDGIDLTRTVILPAGGAHAVGPFLRRFGPQGTGTLAGGLCDAAEAPFLRKGLRLAGWSGTPDDILGRAGFFVCDIDLEDELLRAVGLDAALEIIAREGEADALHTLQAQAAWRDAPLAAQLRRFLSSRAGRKTRYAALFVRAIPWDAHPRPLRAVLDVGRRAG